MAGRGLSPAAGVLLKNGFRYTWTSGPGGVHFSYIKHCAKTVIINKHITVYPNQKSWMTRDVRNLLKDYNIAFWSGYEAQYRTTRAKLKRWIREAKAKYKEKTGGHVTSNSPLQVWQEVQHLSNYKPSNITSMDSDVLLAEDLNCFFARFEVDNRNPYSRGSQTY